jgi:hypothetical protein
MTNGTRRRWGVGVTPRPLFIPGEDPVPIVQAAGWTPWPVWTGAENLASHRDSIPGPSSPYPVAIPTELPGPPFVVHHTKNLCVYCRQPQQILFVLSIPATSFGRTGQLQAFKYTILETQNKMHIYFEVTNCTGLSNFYVALKYRYLKFASPQQ